MGSRVKCFYFGLRVLLLFGFVGFRISFLGFLELTVCFLEE